MFRIISLFFLLLAYSSVGYADPGRVTYYISPEGSDHNKGKSISTPFRSFRKAFRKMKSGDELILLDGTYSDKNKNGFIGYEGRYSDQIPSGIVDGRKTIVKSMNRGKAVILGELFIGRSFRKDHDIQVDGITFIGGGHLYNTENIDILNNGFHGSLVVGTNDHSHGNSRNLIEDSWIWAEEKRIIAINYRSDYNVWRRVIVRGDGCNKRACIGPGNPNVGITVYDSNHVSMQNIIVIDRLLGLGYPYADFAAAQHTPGKYLFGRNEWLGTISINSPDSAYYMEPDHQGTIDHTIKISNAVAWNPKRSGINIARSGTNNLLENITVISSGFDGIRVGKRLTSGIVRNCVTVDSGRYGINSAYGSEYVNVFNSRRDDYNLRPCRSNCYASNPRKDGKIPSLKYALRIEKGSKLNNSGKDNMDIGANIIYRYGAPGSHFGEKGYNALTAEPLWPWPNEKLIKKQMCANTDRGFCSNKRTLDGSREQTLTSYLWELSGFKMPEYLYK